jgi:GAF domain-containing protein
VVDEHGEVVGAAGLSLDIDERVRLLEVERTAAARARFLERTNRALVESLDLDEVIERITTSAIEALADWCSLVVTIDQPASAPLISVAHADPEMVASAEQVQSRFPYDPDARSGVPHVLRTGGVEFVPVIDAGALDALDIPTEIRDVVEQLDLRSSITVPLVGGLGMLGALQLVRTSARPRFTAADVALASELAGQISAALNTTVLFRREQAARAALQALQDFTAKLANLSTTSDIADVVVGCAALFTHADKGLLYMARPDGSLHLAAQVGHSPDELADRTVLDAAADAPVADVVRTREAVVLASRAAIDDRYGHMVGAAVDDAAIVALPMFVAGRMVGGVVVTWRTPHAVSDTELSLLRTIVGRGAGALERARLYETQRSIAVTLQRSLLPAQLSTAPWFTAEARHWPGVEGTEVGGDFYDLFPIADDRWAVTIGDVCGQGVRAAALTAVARHTARSAARHVTSPSDVLERIHDALYAYDGTHFCTVCFMTLERADSCVTARVALGGHPKPLLRRRDGTVEHLGLPGTLLGMIPPHTHTTRVSLEPGDTIVLYTDGVTDAKGSLAVSIDDVAAALTTARGPAGCLAAISELLERRRPDGVTDDTAIIVVQIAPDMNDTLRSETT